MPTPKEHIAVIREEMTGSPRLVKSLREACERLSAGLYRDNGHFFLEFLQNADDNAFADGVVPSLTFTVDADRIVVTVNEVGFSPEDVDGLCAIGNSTKLARKADCTGEKGVGFKAVFKVSRRVEVHSNGYHFCFDLDGELLGALVPTWIDDEAAWPAAAGTTFVLHLTPAARGTVDLREYLNPDVLVFLRRLRGLTVATPRIGETTSLHRADSAPWTTVTVARRSAAATTTTHHRYFKHCREADMRLVVEEKRPNIGVTGVCVAFPVDQQDRADASSPHKVFAFLPVRFGPFPFLGHADFVLTAAREAIIEDLPWNVRLRNELAETLVKGVLAARAAAGLGTTVLTFLTGPAGKLTDPFLQTVVAMAEAQLATEPCAPLAGQGWGAPVHGVMRDAQSIHGLLDEAAFATILGKRLVADVLPPVAAVLRRLKCSTLTPADLVRCCENATWLATRQASGEWVSNLFDVLSQVDLTPALLDRLRAHRIVPLADGTFTSIRAGNVFLTLDGDRAYGFEHELAVIDPRLLAGDKARAARVEKTLFSLGVQRADAAHIVTRHILPKHVAPLKSTAAALLGHARYVRDHFSQLPSDVQQAVGQSLYIRSTKRDGNSNWYNTAANLYLGGAYADPHGGLALLADRIADRQISPDNIVGRTKAARAADLAAWNDFFVKLGVAVLPRLTGQGGDWAPSAELASLIDDPDGARRTALVTLLDAVWDAEYAPRAKTRTGQPSTFLTRLRGMGVGTTRGPATPLGQAYRDTPDNRAVFGDCVPYLLGELKSDKFVTALGVVKAPSLAQALLRLRELSAGPCEKAVVDPLYRFVESRFVENPDLVRDRFDTGKLIWTGAAGGVAWRSPSACCWDVPRAFAPFAPVASLREPWSKYETLFGDGMLKVQRKMTAAQWVATLAALRDSSAAPDLRCRLALDVYLKLNDFLDRRKTASAWVDEFGRTPLLLAAGGWRRAGTVVAADDPQVAELFAGRPGVEFLDVEAADIPAIRRLLAEIGVPLLSKTMIVVPPPAADAEPDASLERQVRRSVLAIARFLFHRHSSLYARFWEEGRFAKLARIKAAVCAPLRVTIRVGAAEQVHAFRARVVGDAEWTLYCDAAWRPVADALAIEIGRAVGVDDGPIKAAIECADAATPASYFEVRNIPELPEREVARFAELNVVPVAPPASDADAPEPELAAEPIWPATATRPPCLPAGAFETVPEADPPLRPAPLPFATHGRMYQSGGTTFESNATDGREAAYSFDDLYSPAPDVEGFQRLRTKGSSGRFTTYVSSDPLPRGESRNGQAMDLTDLAIQHVIASEAALGRTATDVRDSRPGCSVESVAAADTAHLIVVKALPGRWGTPGVGLTPLEFDLLRTTRQPCHLYVVEFVGDPRQAIVPVENPVKRITLFAFDDGWRALAAPDGEKVEVGSAYQLKDGRIGTVRAATEYGKILDIEVELADGSVVSDAVYK